VLNWCQVRTSACDGGSYTRLFDGRECCRGCYATVGVADRNAFVDAQIGITGGSFPGGAGGEGPKSPRTETGGEAEPPVLNKTGGRDVEEG